MIEIRDAGPGYWSLSGLATSWSTAGRPYFVSGPEGTFYEEFTRNAFADATSGKEGVDLLRDHDWNDSPTYATTVDRTLKLANEERGILLGAAIAKNVTANQEIVESIKSGERRGLSVAFRALDEKWVTAPDGRTATRSISRASLREVSICRRPANPSAHILDVRGATEMRSTDKWEFRHFPLTYRDDTGSIESFDEDEPCPACGGTGLVDGVHLCPTCKGTGIAPDDDGDEQDESAGGTRRDFTDAERAALGKTGKALFLDGHWSFPTATKADFDNAVRSLGRTPAKNRDRVKSYLKGRAKAEGWVLPASWTEGRERLMERLALERIDTQREEEAILAPLRGRW